jgi:hypothetical protein
MFLFWHDCDVIEPAKRAFGQRAAFTTSSKQEPDVDVWALCKTVIVNIKWMFSWVFFILAVYDLTNIIILKWYWKRPSIQSIKDKRNGRPRYKKVWQSHLATLSNFKPNWQFDLKLFKRHLSQIGRLFPSNCTF